MAPDTHMPPAPLAARVKKMGDDEVAIAWVMAVFGFIPALFPPLLVAYVLVTVDHTCPDFPIYVAMAASTLVVCLPPVAYCLMLALRTRAYVREARTLVDTVEPRPMLVLLYRSRLGDGHGERHWWLTLLDPDDPSAMPCVDEAPVHLQAPPPSEDRAESRNRQPRRPFLRRLFREHYGTYRCPVYAGTTPGPVVIDLGEDVVITRRAVRVIEASQHAHH